MRAQLPCRFQPRTPGDRPKLVLWYKTGVSRPLFSHDSRVPQVQADLTQAGGDLVVGVSTATLTYHNLTTRHSGVYECRVDFYRSPAHTSLVNLTVVEPVRKVEIIGSEAGVTGGSSLGPFYPGHTLNLTCVSHQGWPPPVLTWWRGDKILKSSREVTAPGRVQNDLVIENISRSWNNNTLTCTASNTRLAAPAKSSVLVQMFLMPSSVKVENPGPVVEGRQAELRCQASGAQPAPTLSWSINGTASPARQSTVEGTVAWSRLVVNVTRSHNGVNVTCTATNPALHGHHLANTTSLIVYYPPSVSISLGRSLQPESLKEGDDVYFTCTVSASPPASAITWFHQGRVKTHNVSEGVVVSGDSLVLQSVRRQQAGQYRCGAANPLARVVSAPVLLRIKFAHWAVKAGTLLNL
ncbi:hemicentin-2-like [Homarus americanus]|uniref:hemicentin-2-like n=1 Tax=Homarus americanus TaxID=6706 RepID=UPI001C457ED1|nr:hemicentin-2-like [Homarus americanus]